MMGLVVDEHVAVDLDSPSDAAFTSMHGLLSARNGY